MTSSGVCGSVCMICMVLISAKDPYVRCLYVCLGLIALRTTLVLRARSLDLLLSVSVRRVLAVLSTAGFKGGGKPRPKTRETDALRRGIRESLANLAGIEPKYVRYQDSSVSTCDAFRFSCAVAAPIMHFKL